MEERITLSHLRAKILSLSLRKVFQSHNNTLAIMTGNRHLLISTAAVYRSLQRRKKKEFIFFQDCGIFNRIPSPKAENKKCREEKWKC